MQALRRISCLVASACLTVAGAAAEVRLFAAASLADALQAIAPEFRAATGHTLQLNLGASGLLARQIREGALADVFFSADEARVVQLADAGYALANTRRVLLSNQLVLVAPVDAVGALEGFAGLTTPAVRRVAIGEPATVPAGTYAREYLQHLGLWEKVSPKIVPLDNVRTVLASIVAGNIDAGIVYRTDAMMEQRLRIVVTVPVAEGPRIKYPAVMLKDARSPDAARALLDYLAGPAAQAVFARFGFHPGASDE